ncbi:MAG: YihY/virulence factor BrkB family protein [Desulfocapsaceae bacterium]|jgi:membrane protein|nr:YihY/virulence factor BrkB family protein [Desulfocapsaceae bacterium]
MTAPPPKPSLTSRLLTWADQSSTLQVGPRQAFHTFVRVLLITAREFRKNELPLRASALTYITLLSLVPLLAMSTALVKEIGGDNHLRQVVYGYIDTLEHNPTTTERAPSQVEAAPAAAPGNTDETTANLTAHLRSAADKIFNYVDKTDFTTLGSIGVLVMLITIIMVFVTIEMAMNAIWQVHSGRSALRKIIDYLALLILMPLAINIGFAATTVIKNPTLLDKIEPFLPVIWLQTSFLLLLPILSITLAFSISYILFPNTRVHPLPALIGALFAGPLWFITQNIFISLQIGVSNYNAIYGSFATLPLFLVWLYFGWIFILSGAQVAFACQARHSYQLLPAPPTPAQQLSAAFDIAHQVFLFFGRQQTLTADMLPDLCPGHIPSLLSSTINQLLSAGIIHIEDKKQHLLPTLPAENLSQGTLVKAILGTDTPDTEGGRQTQCAIEAASQALPLSFQETQKS